VLQVDETASLSFLLLTNVAMSTFVNSTAHTRNICISTWLQGLGPSADDRQIVGYGDYCLLPPPLCSYIHTGVQTTHCTWR
jgi:hypothetical protein